MEKLIRVIKKFIFPPYFFNDKECLIIDIIGSMLKDSQTECITAPVSGIYYVSNQKFQYWIKVWDEGLTLTNHRFSYVHSGNHKFQTIIIKMVQEFMEKDRARFEKEVFQNEIELLKQIKENIIYS